LIDLLFIGQEPKSRESNKIQTDKLKKTLSENSVEYFSL